MTEISERYGRLADDFAAKIADVPDGSWSSQSPCDEWTALDVVEHVVGTQGMFLGFVGRELGDIPVVADDPLGAWNAVRSVVQGSLEDPAQASAEFEGLGGTSTFEAAVNRFLCMDLVVHGWDLARAAGLNDHIDPQDLVRVSEQAMALGDKLRTPRAFGPEVETAADADEQTKVLALLGRRA